MASYEKIIGELAARNSDIDTRVGTVISDIINSIATQADSLSSSIDHVKLIQSLNNVSDFTNDEMDALAANFDCTRIPAQASTCVVVFYRKTYTGNAITIAQNQIVYTSNPKVNFITLETKTIVASGGLHSYYSATNQRYEIPVSVQSTDIGTATNVASHTISNIDGVITNIDGVDNLIAASGGADEETNDSLASRIKLKITNNVGTKNGYEALARSQAGVNDCYVATANDVFMTRDADFGGKVDIYIKGSDNMSVTETIVYNGQTSMILTKQPAKSISSVLGTNAGNITYTFLPSSDYTFTEDTTSIYAGSEQATGRLVWVSSGAKPTLLTNVRIGYVYNALPETIQSVVDGDSNHIVNADVLVKEALSVAIDYTATIAVLSGYSKASVVENCRVAVETALNNYGLGISVEQSDINTIITETDGVDRLNMPITRFCKSTLTGVENVISIGGLNYAVAGTVSIS